MYSLIFTCLLIACNVAPEQSSGQKEMSKIADIACPQGFSRKVIDSSSYGFFLRNFPLKKDKTIHLFDGSLKYRQDVQVAVLDIDVGKRDLQQCADAVMRLRAEYLWKQGKKDKIAFHFVNGQLCEYSKYAQGYRGVYQRSGIIKWELKAKPDTSYKTFRKYMDLVFSYAGTASLIKELKTTKIEKIQIGDVLIMSGKPYGHAITVMDICEKNGEKMFLLAQSYMPAQDIHVLKNPDGGAWYPAKEGEIYTPEWDFHSSDLHRFQ